MPDSLSTLAARLTDTARVVAHLAEVAEEISTDLPVGYRAARPIDGVPRPVEDILIGLEDRGVTPALINGRVALTIAVREAGNAARALDSAISRWESPQSPTGSNRKDGPIE